MFAAARKFRNRNGYGRLFSVLFSLIPYLGVAIGLSIILPISLNYNSIFDMPENIGGAADFSEFSFDGRSTQPSLAGEWEFFYNKWIITDGLTGVQADCMMYTPGKWTDKTIDDISLDAGGYASYRMVLENVRAGTIISVSIPPKTPIPYRTFINGKLNNSCGVLSKERGETLFDGHVSFNASYVPSESEDVTVVIEVANTGFAGLVVPPKLNLPGATVENPTNSKYMLIEYIPFIIFGVMSILLLIQLVMSLALYGEKKELSSFFLMAALFVQLIFSKDLFLYVANLFSGIQPYIFYLLNALAGFAVFVRFYCILEGRE